MHKLTTVKKYTRAIIIELMFTTNTGVKHFVTSTLGVMDCCEERTYNIIVIGLLKMWSDPGKCH